MISRENLNYKFRNLNYEELANVCGDPKHCPALRCPFKDVSCLDVTQNMWKNILSKYTSGNGNCCKSCRWQMYNDETDTKYCKHPNCVYVPSSDDECVGYEEIPAELIDNAAPTPAKAPESSSNRGHALLDAYKVINGERQDQYGSPENNFRLIAQLWNVAFNDKLVAGFTAHDVAIAMSLLKIARIQTGSGKADSYVDLAGYAALAADIKEQE